MHIAIPTYFSLYNADKQEVKEKGWTPQGSYYENLTRTFGKASDCIGCGQCEGVCPQHLPIIRHLTEVAGYFEK
jgi:predicted aldo/keto reductase-like oxidoreductase